MQHLGELVAQTTLDLIHTTERNNNVTHIKDGIAWGLVENDDVVGVLSRKIFLLPPKPATLLLTYSNRLDFALTAEGQSSLSWGCIRATRGLLRAHALSKPIALDLVLSALHTAERARDSGDMQTSFLHLISRTLDLVHPGHHVLADVLSYPLYSAGVLRHKLTALGYGADVLAEASGIVGGGPLGELNASAGAAAGGSMGNIGSAASAVAVLTAIARPLRRACRWYIEFTVPVSVAWRVGVEVFHAVPVAGGGAGAGGGIPRESAATASAAGLAGKPGPDEGYPGMADDSMGVSYDGNVYVGGLPTRYVSEARLLGLVSAGGAGKGTVGFSRSALNSAAAGTVGPAVADSCEAGADVLGNSAVAPQPPSQQQHHVPGLMRTYGLLVDMSAGTLSLVIENRVLSPPAFGHGADHFSPDEQKRQIALMHTQMLVPMFALNGSASKDGAHEMRVNFGLHPFTHQPPDALSANEYFAGAFARDEPLPTLADDLAPLSVATAATATGGGGAQGGTDEDERVQIALEKNHFRATVATEDDRSWSQFPPSVYKRSLAATRIQRAWRIYRGRRWRKSMIAQQMAAATMIQRMARRKLARIREMKNTAARVIQRNWRIRVYMKMALLRLRYQRPITELHQAAKTIQTKFRDWAHFRNSPFASRFRKQLELLNRSASVIQAWWRPIAVKLRERRARDAQNRSATTIQRIWRGYALRSVLRPDIRSRLSTLGKSLVRHRVILLRVHAAMRIQTIWREFRMRRVRAQKIRTRNAAATRIQALWKGYWIRSHIHLRFDYGESVFLSAVCKNLRAAHFIPKMYKPCGIVCPRRDRG
ncbi:hypothetical protein BCR44DRAFT_1195279 [Catenaria anguillulae PL171]|uniref:Uncharacterized protein n=1 Tax=Catenaria anguillulae PL171 TaxID=765915 RepID=A0A1Y2HIH4_9FUNG|nr:hypothetical protein BCR44DRAFT_1195279 [Catenaria anguillulae PL171]